MGGVSRRAGSSRGHAMGACVTLDGSYNRVVDLDLVTWVLD